MLTVVIANNRLFLIFKISRKRKIIDLSFNILGKLMNSIPLLTK